MRVVTLALLSLLAVVHAELWFGKGGVPRVMALTAQLEEHEARNRQAQQFNEQLAAEVRDLQEGLEMVEEKARSELGMVRPDEIYVQLTTSRLAPIQPPVAASGAH